MRTQVGVIGAGPAGLFLAHLLAREGIDCVVIEARSREYVEARVRAGVLEHGTLQLLTELGLDTRLRQQAMFDRVLDVRFDGRIISMGMEALTGRFATVYGQQEVVKDLVATRLEAGGQILFEAEAVGIDHIDGSKPEVRFKSQGDIKTLECDFVAACDGFHGIGRSSIPEGKLDIFDLEYPFAWFGILSRSPPIKEMTYSNHERGFALCSRRSLQVSRHYIQVPAEEDISKWSDAQFWDELHIRMGDDSKSEIIEGEIFQRDIAQLRAFVAAPMQYGRLYLAGDAAHIVPPTGAKGLNLAVADALVLSRGISDFYRTGDTARLDRYSETCLKRVWKVERFSNYMTRLLHRFDTNTRFDRQLQLAELEYLAGSTAMQTVISENYVGLPLEDR